ncbi:kinase-like domain-containing protein [Absidia repens]|uniref:Kinase-like domain-containing protein n=1 Tax=Absidia repens TaxID=90262 RepID=A0A1X2IRG3_9FUNG|nr:kinase-like domain-containing protein [Absidia repens]
MVLAGHSLVPWKSAESLKQHQQNQQPINSTSSTVVTTNTVFKDYDPVTGNKIINGKYMIIRELGRGVHGKVKLAHSLETGEPVAIKIVDKRTRKRQLSHAFLRPTQQLSSSIDKENEQKIRREIAILKKCVHPHVVQLMEIMEDPESNKIYMVLEYMDGGEIEWRDEQDRPVLDIDHTRSIFRDVVSGLDYCKCHSSDIKPANLLYSKDHVVKISDFGVSYFNKVLAGGGSKEMEASQRSDQVDRELAETAGTPAFFAPELCWAGDNRQDYRHQITRSIDVWALGVTLYCFIFGQCPFIAATEYELFEVIPTQPLIFPDDHRTGPLDEQLKDLLERLLEKNPQERITLEQVKTHPWVIQDLQKPEEWWHEADPRHYQTVCVTDDEVTHAYTIMDRLRRSIHRLSNSLSHLTQNITRRRSKSSCQTRPTSKQLFHTSTPASGPSSAINVTSLLPLSPPPTTTLSKSSILPSTASSVKSVTTPYPIAPLHPTDINYSNDDIAHQIYSSDKSDTSGTFDGQNQLLDHDHDAEDDDNGNRTRYAYQRNNSSTSSMSGLVVSFSRHREPALDSSPPPLPSNMHQ